MAKRNIYHAIVLCITMFVHFSASTDESDDEQDSDYSNSQQICVRPSCFFSVINSAWFGIRLGSIQFLITLPVSIPFYLIFRWNIDPYDGQEPGLCDRIVGAVIEEIVFHCVLQPLLTQSINRICNSVSCNREVNSRVSHELANCAISGLFGAAHLANPTPTVYQCVGSTINCFYRGRLFIRHGRIAVIMSHVTYNFLPVLVCYILSRAER